jgi:hypothetical protein
MKWWIKIGCFLTGWNYDMLCYCSEASFKYLKKYTSALLILCVIWGLTGWCFADRYVKAPWWGCLLTALTCIIIVIQVERQIILTIGKNYLGKGLRILVAFLMAILSSTTLDQIIFADDIDRKKIEIIEEEIDTLLPKRTIDIDEELRRSQADIDSLNGIQRYLHEEIAKKPYVTKRSTETNQTPDFRDGIYYGEIIQKIVRGTPEENPRIKEVEANDKKLENLQSQHRELLEKRKLAENDLRKELKENTSFLEELDVMIKIVSERITALLFWIFLFCFLLFLELFVVISKLMDDECDYDAIVKYQMARKKLAIGELEKTASFVVTNPQAFGEISGTATSRQTLRRV